MTEPTLIQPVAARTRRINDLIWESLDDDGAGGPVAFFCECAREGCYLPVWLTSIDYEQGRRLPDWVALAPAHQHAKAG